MKARIIIPLLLLVVTGLAGALYWQHKQHNADKQQWENAKILLISKQEKMLRLIDYKGKELFSAPVAIGLNEGNKVKQGDMRTPEGVFRVADIQNASAWEHDFGDGKGKIKGAYGDYFIRLDVPGHSGIGIHGTHLPESIGSRASEGCIRLKNDDLSKLVTLIYPPLTVIITPAAADEHANKLQKSRNK